MTASTNPSADKQLFYLDDLQVGQRFVSGTHLIDEKQIVAFASQFDPQPFHLDAEAAKHTLFAGLVASGWHTAAITMRLMVDGGLPIAGGLVGAGGECAWPKPTRPGASCTSKARSLNSARHDPVRTAAWQPSAVKRAISSARSCRCWSRSWSCRARFPGRPAPSRRRSVEFSLSIIRLCKGFTSWHKSLPARSP